MEGYVLESWKLLPATCRSKRETGSEIANYAARTCFFHSAHNPKPKLFLLMMIWCLPVTDSFVNSQEWTISRSVPDLRLGIVGSLNSGKSALVHRYLTGSYMQEESPEGGRFKKEVFIDGQSYLLLIRDEGGAPEMQVSFLFGIYLLLLVLLCYKIFMGMGTGEMMYCGGSWLTWQPEKFLLP